jgi:hypothetical protein
MPFGVMTKKRPIIGKDSQGFIICGLSMLLTPKTKCLTERQSVLVSPALTLFSLRTYFMKVMLPCVAMRKLALFICSKLLGMLI